MKRAQDEQVR
jgi:hypothetical protein